MEHSKDLASAGLSAAGRIFSLAPSDALQEQRVLSQGLLLLCHRVCHWGVRRAEGVAAEIEGLNTC